ncbi:LysR family transcriptional regulator [Yunchengibacter salinarum]|uniref:LysR family transcriptional regulator n=1 Tax=Yunchengibacter salinarum TaxID=3133399 RepID=UPI0035B67A62
MDWDRLRIFHAVAQSGSFTRAGTALNSSQSAISRQIRTLEESLGTALFTRHARGLVLTEDGRRLYATAEDVVRRIEETERQLMESREKPAGLLRVTTMVTFGAVWLTPHLNQFLEQYPDIDIKLILDDEDVDLSTGKADVAIRLHEPEHADLIARPLATFHAHIYASPAYLDRKGTPRSRRDLDHHDLITFGETGSPTIKGLNWLMAVSKGTKRAPRLQVNNLYGVLHAVEAGLGLAVLPDYLVHDRKKLVRVLPEEEGTTFRSFYCYPPELKGSQRVNLFRDFMIRQIRSETDWL